MSSTVYTTDILKKYKDDVNLRVVMEELKKSIEEQLNKCGLYYRIFNRVKTNESLAAKLECGDYGCGKDDKKVQDLIGIRVVLYYSDDLAVCRNILEKTYIRNGEWSENQMTVNQFQATKINGVFEIPQRLLELIDDRTWKLPVDATFEVQIRTVLFEGWHEIEHDMRYKDLRNNKKTLWDDNEGLARTMNSILASLELCDWSLSSLFQTLARNHMEHKHWERMIRCRYRLRMDDKPLNQAVRTYLDEHVDVADRLYKCDKSQLIEALLEENVHTKISYDVLIKVLNMYYINDPALTKLLADTKLRVYEQTVRKNVFIPLENRTTFQLDVALNDENASQEDTTRKFREAVDIIYNWARYKSKEIFPDMEEEPRTYRGTRPGYTLYMDYNPGAQQFILSSSRIDSVMPGTIWYTETSLENKNGRLLFFCVTSCSAPEDEIPKIGFRKPKFVDRIHEQMDFYDVQMLPRKVNLIESEQTEEQIRTLINHPARCLPVVVVGWDEEADRFLLHADKLLNTVGDFAHIYGQKTSLDGSVMIFWSDGTYRSFSRDEILSSRFDYNRSIFADEDLYEIPFRHKIVNLIRDRNNGIVRDEKDTDTAV